MRFLIPSLGSTAFRFFLVLILAQWISDWFYDKNTISTVFFVGLLSLIEGGIALTWFKILDSDFSWNLLFFQTVTILAVIQGLISPLFLLILIRMERILHLDPEGKPSIPFRW